MFNSFISLEKIQRSQKHISMM